MTDEERTAFTAQQRQRTTDMWTRINGVLNAEQQTKFKEIYFQANNGLNNVTTLDDWMLATLDLTATQKEAIVRIVDARAAANRAAMPAGGVGGGPGQAQTAEARAEATARNTRFADQIKAVLTPAQTTKATQLTTGAAALREAIGIRAPGQQGGPGQGAPGAAPGGGAGQRGQGAGGGAGGGGFTPGSGTGNNFQPGQRGGGQGGGPAAGGGAGGGRQGGAGGAGGGARGGGGGGGN